MKNIQVIFMMLICTHGFSLTPKPNTTYIFNYIEPITACSDLGTPTGVPPIAAPLGGLFDIARILANGDVVIKFKEWKGAAPQLTYNFTNNLKTSVKYFLLTKTDYDRSCAEFVYNPSWNIAFGTLTTPFRFRNHPALFTTNLSLGATVAFTWKLYKNFTVGVIPGISLTQVELDEFSTNGKVTEKTERPAFTPSASFLVGYKNVNITAGWGWDIINELSDVEKSWVYGGKPWFGLGIGINLFNSNKDAPSNTDRAVGQSTKEAKTR